MHSPSLEGLFSIHIFSIHTPRCQRNLFATDASFRSANAYALLFTCSKCVTQLRGRHQLGRRLGAGGAAGGLCFQDRELTRKIYVHRCKGATSWDAETEPVVQPVSPEQLRAVWDALVTGRPAPPSVAVEAAAAGNNGNGGGCGSSDSAVVLTARVEQQVKQQLTLAAEHFNRDYRKGFQFIQVC